jgi:PhoH-like ATPase
MSATQQKSNRTSSTPEKKATATTLRIGGQKAPYRKKIEIEIPQPTKVIPAKNKKTKALARESKLFVLDTNVLMHDPSALFRFQEHDVYLPMITLEELDNHKSGTTDVSRNVRTVSRTMDALLKSAKDDKIENGLSLSSLGSSEAGGRLFFQTDILVNDTPIQLTPGKADNEILSVVAALHSKLKDKQVILVSKDINMRIKARALQLAAEDYFNDQVLQDSDLLYSGHLELPVDFWENLDETESFVGQHLGLTSNGYLIKGKIVSSFLLNQYVYLPSREFHAKVVHIRGDVAKLVCLKDFSGKANVWGVNAKNHEQNFALNLLMDSDCDFVSLLGQAGTGKTLLAIAAGLSQVFDQKTYSEILVTRATVPVGDEIGFLPGTEEEKMAPWLGALDDNLEFLCKSDSEGGEWGKRAGLDMIRSKIKIKSMSFMRGRTFVNKFVIIDEAQNLTAKQAKTLITRAGPGTKMIFMGNIAQIDTPWLTEGSSGLTHVVDRFKGWAHGGHITLVRGERSRLADHANEVL